LPDLSLWYAICPIKKFLVAGYQEMSEQNPGGQDGLPHAMPVSILMESRPSVSKWADEYWQAVGIAVGRHGESEAGEPQLVFAEQSVRRYLHTGFRLRLYPDQCESYYHNMVSPNPRCYIIAEKNESGVPQPILVSMSFDEAHSYLEGDDEIFAVDIPPEIYVWTEAYVIANYFPEKKTKRKRTDWKQQPGDATCEQ
jgi:hypothetical protein